LVEFYSPDISLLLSPSLFGNEIKININGKLSPQFLMKRLEKESNKETKKAALSIKNPDVNEKQ
jgi:hypothetical protein